MLLACTTWALRLQLVNVYNEITLRSEQFANVTYSRTFRIQLQHRMELMFGTRIDRSRERANQSESISNAIKRKTLAKEDRGISANAIISTVCSLWNTRWYEGFRKRTSSSGYASASVSLRATAETLLLCPFLRTKAKTNKWCQQHVDTLLLCKDA